MDKITIKRLEVFANHGVLKEENVLGQKFYVSCVMYLDTRKAGLKDSLEDTINYSDVCHRITGFLSEHTYQLIEAAAEELAKELLHAEPLLRAVDLEIEKPWAPIGLPLETVSVSIHRGWHTAYIALGSNMGDKKAYIQHGIDACMEAEDIRVHAVSDLVETKPYGVTDQDDFLNGCIKVETLFTPEELLGFLQEVECSANRVRERKWGPRTLDMDLVFYEDFIIDSKDLKIPHPDMHHRDFVLVPMQQIAPNYCHPVLHKTMDMLAKELDGEKTIIKKTE